jgi:hypothetical protein
MSFVKRNFATEPIRRYLWQKIMKAGSTPEKLPGERDIAKMFELSRVTVRRAIAELENSGAIIRLPGRRGAFSNPAVSFDAKYTIGIVIYQDYIGQFFSLILSGIMQELYGVKHGCSFSLYHNSGGLEKTIRDLKYSGYDAVIWHTQTPDDLKMIDHLTTNGINIIPVMNPNYPEWGTTETPYIGFDMEDSGKVIADFFIYKNCHGVIYIGDKSVICDAFETRLASRFAGQILTSEIKQKLPNLLKNKHVDGFFLCPNNDERKSIESILASSNGLSSIKIMLPPRHSSPEIIKRYPQLDISALDYNFFAMQCIALGEHVAQTAKKLILHKEKMNKTFLLKNYKY